MAPSINDLVTQATNGTRPVPDTLTAIKAIGASSISCGALTGWPTASAVHFIIYTIDTNGNKVAGSQTDWKGVVSGTSITALVLKAGSDNGYSVGAVVEAAPTAAWADDLYSGFTQDHDTRGRHSKLTDTNGNKIVGLNPVASAVNDVIISNSATGQAVDIAAEGSDSNIDMSLTPKGTGGIILKKRFDNWITGLPTPNTVTNNGGRNYSVVFNGVDLTSYISNGHRLKLTRTATAPTQSTLLNGSTQFYNKTSPAGMTFTNNFVVAGWVKLPAYGSVNVIASRYNGTSGWHCLVNSDGRLILDGFNGSASNFSRVNSYASIPIGRWVHIAMQLDMATFTATPTTSYVMIDGQDVAALVTRAGTNPTALVQAGNFELGSENGGSSPFAGKLAQIAVYSAKVTQATIAGSMNQTLTGSEASLVSAYSFSNSITDLNTSNANNLTAQGSAVATNVDSPFAGGSAAASAYSAGTTEYGEVFDVTFSTNTTVNVQVPYGYAIPTSGGVSAVAYSAAYNPLGWPGLPKTLAMAILQIDSTQTSTSFVIMLGLSLAAYIPKNRQARLIAWTANLRNQTASKNARLAMYNGGSNTSISGATGVQDNNSFQGVNDGGESVSIIVQEFVPPTPGSNIFSLALNSDSAGTAVASGGVLTPIYLAVELD